MWAKTKAVFVIDKSRKRKVALSILEEFEGIVVSLVWRIESHLRHATKMPAALLSRHVPHKRKELLPQVFQALLHPASYSQGCNRGQKGTEQQKLQKGMHQKNKKTQGQGMQVDGQKVRLQGLQEICKASEKGWIDSLFTFILHDVQYHNNISERIPMAFAEARKVLYGSRTKKGADRTATMMSVHATCAESIFMILPKSVWQKKQR